MIKGINKSRTRAKHIPCGCRCEIDGRKYNSRQKQNNNECQCECKKPVKHPACEDYVWNTSTCACECNKDWDISEYLKDCECIESLVDDLVVPYNEIVDTPERALIESVNKKATIFLILFSQQSHPQCC